LREAVAELGKQTGYKISIWPEAPPNGDQDKLVYSFHFNQLPFWEALDRVCEAGGLVAQHLYYGDENLRLQYQDSYVPRARRSGPFRVVAQGSQYNRSIPFGTLPRQAPLGQQGPEELTFSLVLATEPRLPLLRVGTVRLTEARDDENRSMLPGRTEDPSA